jgi:hypothetical protein
MQGRHVCVAAATATCTSLCFGARFMQSNSICFVYIGNDFAVHVMYENDCPCYTNVLSVSCCSTGVAAKCRACSGRRHDQPLSTLWLIIEQQANPWTDSAASCGVC